MAKITWTNNALSDLGDKAVFIARDSPKFAELTIKKLYQKVEILTHSPGTGRIVPEIEKDHLRELIDGNYQIIYEIEGNNFFYPHCSSQC